MTKVLFLIHDLGPGGAEKVLVNLVNNLDPARYDITVMSLFDVGINRRFLKPHIRYLSCFRHMIRGNIHLLKLLTPRQLHRWLIREHYDIEVSYLEGPCARIISGCPDPDTKLVSWIHIEQHTYGYAARSFRSIRESAHCYERFHNTVCVSEYVRKDFLRLYPGVRNAQVLYNTNETDQILRLAQEPVEEKLFGADRFCICGVGKLIAGKGFDRLLRIQKRLVEAGYPVHVLLLGVGQEQQSLQDYTRCNGLEDRVTFLGYQTNPYKYVAKSDLFVCASWAEGFSTAATEALIVGTPVCTVEVSGMKEMLGEDNEYGIVTENDEDALYDGIRRFLDDPALAAHYRTQAKERGKCFSTRNTVAAVEAMLDDLLEDK